MMVIKTSFLEHESRWRTVLHASSGFLMVFLTKKVDKSPENFHIIDIIVNNGLPFALSLSKGKSLSMVRQAHHERMEKLAY
jgi:hypothetical protein